MREHEAHIDQISREMGILEASPYAWLALESEEFDYKIPYCVKVMIKQLDNNVSLSCENV